MKFSIFLLLAFALNAYGFNMPFIFNRIKPGSCPENSDLLGRDPARAVCTTNCMHDYDCGGTQLCCPSDCNGRTCIDPAPRVQRLSGPKTCLNIAAITNDAAFPCNNNGFRRCTSNYFNQCPETHRCCMYACGGVCIQV